MKIERREIAEKAVALVLWLFILSVFVAAAIGECNG